jgi:cation transport ATPase
MKRLFLLIFTIALLISTSAIAQKKTEEVKIKTSAQCEKCKTRIETAMAYEKGIVSSNLNLEDKVLTVVYKTGKTTPDAIRKALNQIGYDADETLANAAAYDKLPSCCKKPDDPEHTEHND